MPCSGGGIGVCLQAPDACRSRSSNVGLSGGRTVCACARCIACCRQNVRHLCLRLLRMGRVVAKLYRDGGGVAHPFIRDCWRRRWWSNIGEIRAVNFPARPAGLRGLRGLGRCLWWRVGSGRQTARRRRLNRWRRGRSCPGLLRAIVRFAAVRVGHVRRYNSARSVIWRQWSLIAIARQIRFGLHAARRSRICGSWGKQDGERLWLVRAGKGQRSR